MGELTMLKDDARIKGVVNLVLRDEHGRVKQHKTIRNAVTEYGIAHIIGRMIDPDQSIDGDGTGKHILPRMMSHMAIGSGTEAASKYDRILQNEPTELTRVQMMKDTSRASDYSSFEVTIESDSAESFDPWQASAATVLKTVGTGNALKVRVGMTVESADSSYTTFPANTTVTAVSTADSITTITLNNSLTSFPSDGNLDLDFQYVDILDDLDSTDGRYASALSTNDYGVNRGKIGAYYNPSARSDPPFEGEAPLPDNVSTYEQYGTSVDGVYQGRYSGTSILKDTGVDPEGYPTSENNYNTITNPVTVANGGTPNAVPGTKRNGDRIVFVATFKANNPSLSEEFACTEAGIFNKDEKDGGTFDTTKNVNAGTTDATTATTTTGGTVTVGAPGFTGDELTQTMLCRTTFSVVNKASTDTLQITWSVQLSDTSS